MVCFALLRRTFEDVVVVVEAVIEGKNSESEERSFNALPVFCDFRFFYNGQGYHNDKSGNRKTITQKKIFAHRYFNVNKG